MAADRLQLVLVCTVIENLVHYLLRVRCKCFLYPVCTAVIVFIVFLSLSNMLVSLAITDLTSCRREAASICPRPVTFTFDLLTLKAVSESFVTWATSMPILVFLCLSGLELGPMYATDKRQTECQKAALLNAPPRGGGISHSCPCDIVLDKFLFVQ